MRSFEQSHPWISFTLDLRRVPWTAWVKLGECQALCQRLALVPLRPDTARKLHRVYLAKGALATVAIEGNTLTEEQVRAELEGELRLPPSREYLRREIQNVIGEFNRLGELVLGGACPLLNLEQVCEFNRKILHDLELDENVVPGEIRRHSVSVGRYRAAPAEDCRFLVERMCEWLGGETFKLREDLTIVFAIIKATMAHLYFAWIHPFGDGNGRTARLIEFQTLLSAGVPAPAAQLLSNHYNQTRAEYYRQLDRASASGGDVIPFLEYAINGFLEGLHEQFNYVTEQQIDVAWRNYIHELFRDGEGVPKRRQRELILELSRQGRPVPFKKIGELSPKLATSYARVKERTLKRDLMALMERDLVVQTGQGYRAKREIMLQFFPGQAVPE